MCPNRAFSITIKAAQACANNALLSNPSPTVLLFITRALKRFATHQWNEDLPVKTILLLLCSYEQVRMQI